MNRPVCSFLFLLATGSLGGWAHGQSNRVASLEPIYPLDAASNVDISKPFELPTVAPSHTCEMRVSEAATFDGFIFVRELKAGMSQVDIKGILSPEKQYYWQAQCREVTGAQPLVAKSKVLSFKTAAISLPKLSLITPPPDARNVSVFEDVRFTWNRYTRAESYKLYVSKKNAGKNDKPVMKEITYSQQVDPPNPQNPPYEFVELKPGTDYIWHIEALIGKEVVAKADDQGFQTRTAVFDEASKAGFKLQRAFTLIESLSKGDPATFGFAAQHGARPSFNAEFALQWLGKDPESGQIFRPEASVEARLHSSGEAKGKDAIKARLSAEADISHRAGFSSYVLTSLKYEIDRKANTEKVLAEFTYSPNIACVIGQLLPCDKDDYTGRTAPGVPYTYIWRPYVGFDAGRSGKVGESLEDEKTVIRGVVRLTGRVNLRQLAELLTLPNVSVFVDDYNRYLFKTSNQRNNNYFQTGMDFFINEAFSVALRGNIGRDAPNFKFDRNFGINLGVRF